MAAFKNVPETFARLDWQILENGPISLYHDTEILEEAIHWFQDNQYVVFMVDCSQWKSEADFHESVGKTLGFREGYGRNLDAFNDSLSEIEIPKLGGVVLVFRHFDSFARHIRQVRKDYAWDVLDIIANNARRFLLMGQILITLLQVDDPGVNFNPVGATSVLRNPREAR